ncbi:MAG: hypothetical protein JSV88_24915 [Candidatus Aminicenantes bacterium]|nr:MAG: hypothetical protein JSV88_24915 [Candidatus Aminicenantes bacterium]
MNKFPASVPRKMFWSTDIGGTSACPECGSQLEPEYNTYVMLIRAGGASQSFVMGNEGGHFCNNCPTVVLDYEEFNKFAFIAAQAPDSAFVVSGIVDLSAIPPEKRNVPMGGDDNPVPLVKFLDPSLSKTGIKGTVNNKGKHKNKKHKKRKRKRK